LTDRRSGNAGKGNTGKQKHSAEDLAVPETGSRHPRIGTEEAPIRLRYWGRGLGEVAADREVDLAQIVFEMPLSELSRQLPQGFAVELYKVVKRFFQGPGGPGFPCPLGELRQNRGLLSALRARLPLIDTLIELITDPPAILMDERQQLCFFKGIPVTLRPISFTYLFLLAQSPGQFVMRSAIYNQLWPGEMDYEGSDKPYEQQVTDHKYQLAAEIKKGIAGRLRLNTGEIAGMFSTQYKRGYRLNLSRENVLVFTKMDLLMIAFLFLLRRWFEALPGWLTFWRCLGSIEAWTNQFLL
jgi:DNA-binding winged helix-turn-helix (wHTH) protein